MSARPTSASQPWKVDDSRWPIVYVTWPREVMTDPEFAALLEHLAGLTARAKPYCVIHDARLAVRPTPKQRAFAAKQMHSDAPASRKWLCGAALVVSNSLMAGVATAINWITPSPFPQKFFSSLGDAEAWATRQLTGHHHDPEDE